MSVWNEFGFRENPYATTPVPPTEEGQRLLVGRENELSQLLLYLSSAGSHVTVEGDNGVGKTSLVAIAGFEARERFLEGDSPL
jgi:MoxR-like ATPase